MCAVQGVQRVVAARALSARKPRRKGVFAGYCCERSKRSRTPFCTTGHSAPFLRASSARTDLWVRNRSRQSCSLARHDSVRASRRLAPSMVAPGWDDRVVLTNLPQHIPVTREELAIWRAFLAAEIEAILRNEQHTTEPAA